MARPKKKSALVDGFQELVETIRAIDAKVNQLIKQKKNATAGRRGRPPGKKSGRPAAATVAKTGSGKRGRPKGSKNKPKE